MNSNVHDMRTPPRRRLGREVLRTRRLSLHELSLGDAAELLVLDRTPRVHELLLDDHASSLDQGFAIVIWASQFYRQHPGLGIWSTYDAERRFIGTFSLMPVDGGDVEIGVRLLPAHWGRGYPLEAGHALCAHAFDTLQLPRLIGLVHPDNRGARLALRRLGFGEDGECLHFGKPALRHVLDSSDWHRNAGRLSR